MSKSNRSNGRGPAINERISSKMVRVVSENGEMLGVLKIEEALNKAFELGVDLVEVSPNANPPVCKIIDYGKFKYQLQKKQAEAKKKQKTFEVKEVKFGLECGRGLENYNDIKVGDVMECFEIKEVKKIL